MSRVATWFLLLLGFIFLINYTHTPPFIEISDQWMLIAGLTSTAIGLMALYLEKK
jgi:low affinity Fe/Cu permease